jgi:hypothetical protein
MRNPEDIIGSTFRESIFHSPITLFIRYLLEGGAFVVECREGSPCFKDNNFAVLQQFFEFSAARKFEDGGHFGQR